MIESLGFYLQPVFIQKHYALLTASGAAALTGRRNVRGLAKLTAGREGRHFPIKIVWMISSLLKADRPNCETETANRTIQSVSLTVHN